MSGQAASRAAGERCAHLTLLQLLCAVSVWRTAMTRILPLCGASAWWVTLACMIPGVIVAALLRLTMRLTHTETLAECIRVCLGRIGAVGVSAGLAGLLLTEAVSDITALITLFTEGLGTRGTQLTLAVLTGVTLLFSLHREGLSRAAHFLRWMMAGAAAAIAACLLGEAKLDHLFPLYGDGEACVFAALRAGAGIGWPFVLLLTVQPVQPGRLRRAVLPGISAVAAMLLVTLTLPHELLVQQEGLARLLLLPTRYESNILRIIAMCLVMLTFFLSIGASAQLATAQLCLPWKRLPPWLPHALLAGLFLTQAGDVSALWRLLGWIEPWLLAPLAVTAAVCLPIAFFRRKP